MRRILVTEGSTDANLMKSLLSSADLFDIQVLVGGGKSSAMSLGTSLALNFRASVAIVVDADTTDLERLKEQHDIFDDLQRRSHLKGNCKLFLAMPTLEEELFPCLEELQKAFPSLSVPAGARYPKDWNKIAKPAGMLTENGEITKQGISKVDPNSVPIVMSKPIMRELITHFSSHG